MSPARASGYQERGIRWIQQRPAWYSAHLLRTAVKARYDLVRSVTGPDPSCSTSDRQAAYIVGSGRSGTSILGAMCAGHQSINYLFEPNARWAAVCPATDVWGTYGRHAGRAALGGADVTARVRERYVRLFPDPPGQILLDKSPAHTLRLGFLAELVPEAQFLHIHRDGFEVASSTLRWSSESQKLLFGHVYNFWWGVDDAKWRALLASEPSQDPLMLGGASFTPLQRAAYEWVLSLEAVSRHRHQLGDRLFDVQYSQLVREPETVLKAVQRFLGLADDEKWFRSAVALVETPSAPSVSSLRLPAPVAVRFNDLQALYGYSRRAEAI